MILYHFYSGRVDEFEMVGIADLFRGLDLPLQRECPPHSDVVRSVGGKPEGVSERIFNLKGREI